MKLLLKKIGLLTGYILFFYVMLYFLLMSRSIEPYDLEPFMAQSRFYFSEVVRPYKSFPKHEVVTIKHTSYYYYFFCPVDQLLNLMLLKNNNNCNSCSIDENKESECKYEECE
jgi:hypothetical protein